MGDSPSGKSIPPDPGFRPGKAKRRKSGGPVVAFPAVLAERLRDFAGEHPVASLDGYDPRENAGFALLSSGHVAVVSLSRMLDSGVWYLCVGQTTCTLPRRDVEEILVAFGAVGGVGGRRADGWRWFAWDD
ncbi:MAG: hypothetical protein M0Z27_07575 [Thermaerobacter sp.]|nr:hypothetical protein [Thermaerobacter sp.]